jgi:hypothetical protein
LQFKADRRGSRVFTGDQEILRKIVEIKMAPDLLNSC